MKRSLFITAVLSAALAAGCTGESSLPGATGKGTVRAINTIPTSPQIDFLIEERLVASVNYKSATAARQYDDLDYRFNFEVVFPTGRQRVASRLLDVIKDRDYTFVISGALANPTITINESDVRLFDESDTVFAMRFGHFGATLGDIDVYVDAPGIAPVLGQQVTTLSVGDISDALDYTSSDYDVILTAAGDPTTVLFTSVTIAPAARSALMIGVFDGDANDLAPISVRRMPDQGETSRLPDANLPPTIRFHHASMALGIVDVYNDDPATAAPVVTDHAYRDVTADIPVMTGSNSIRYTPAGDTVTFLIEDSVTPFAGTRANYYVFGEADAYSQVAVTPDRRSVETLVKFTVLHAASNHPTVDFYLVDADADITDLDPLFFGLPVGTPPLLNSLQEGSYDIYVTTAGEKTVVAGPYRLDAALGDVVDLIVYDNVDPATADIVLIPNP